MTCIREIRRAKGLTLADVAARCDPPTTAQTIGRLETGMRVVSVGWLNRIAAALGATTAELVRLPDQADLPVAAALTHAGAAALRAPRTILPPLPAPGAVALTVDESVGDYRAGDVMWCERVAPERFGTALNRDVLAPRRAGGFVFGRLIAAEPDRLLLMPPTPGARQTVVRGAPWIAVGTMLIRRLQTTGDGGR